MPESQQVTIRNQIRGMTPPAGVEDSLVAQMFQELQDNITVLAGLADSLQTQVNNIEIPAPTQAATIPEVEAGSNIEIRRAGSKILISAAPIDAEYIIFEVVEIKDDYLMCAPVTAIDEAGNAVVNENAGTVSVAKPWLLRKTPFDGKTRDEISYEYDETDPCKRTATKDGEEEVQSVTPSYSARAGEVSGEVIVAVRCDTLLKEVGGNKMVLFQEINLGGRCWAVDDSE